MKSMLAAIVAGITAMSDGTNTAFRVVVPDPDRAMRAEMRRMGGFDLGYHLLINADGEEIPTPLLTPEVDAPSPGMLTLDYVENRVWPDGTEFAFSLLDRDGNEIDATVREKRAMAADADRLGWWTHDRFGMFIHFGLYALPARHEWVKTRESLPEERYDLYLRHFDPDKFDAREWARAAKAAGMRYAVLTTKHHEGFCLWDSKATDYTVVNTPFGRDIVREFVDAFRAEGLKVGFYYSLIDWHHPDFTVDRMHPLCPEDIKWKEGGGEKDHRIVKLNEGRDMARYRDYMKRQIEELLTGYGKIDIAWFDYSYPGAFGKGRDDWDSKGIVALARRLQPGIIIDNRLDLQDVPGGWDFITPEQYRLEKRPLVGGRAVPWETCQTFSGSWGYYRDEATWKSPAQLVSLLAGTVACGGNLILNVGPTGRGVFDARAKKALCAVGEWMDLNARAIYGCREAPAEFKAPAGSVLTWNPAARRLYVVLTEWPMGKLRFDFGDRVEYAQMLHDASEIEVRKRSGELNIGGGHKARVADDAWEFVLPVVKPDVEIPVIEVFLKDRKGEAK